MKIVGITRYKSDIQANGISKMQMYVKPDSALLVNNKPFFLPLFASRILVYPCMVAHINRLGRNIGSKFANRYYDEWSLGLNFIATDDNGNVGWTRQIAFDNSLCVGHKLLKDTDLSQLQLVVNEQETIYIKPQYSLEETIAEVSQYVTLRMGDMVAVDLDGIPFQATANQKIEAYIDQERVLLCRIKFD